MASQWYDSVGQGNEDGLQPFYFSSRGPVMLLYHFNWVFSHASWRPVNWKLAGRHHASQRSVNTWKFGHGREKNGKFLWKYLFPWKIPLLTFKLVNSSKYGEIRSNFFETDAFEKKFTQENEHLDGHASCRPMNWVPSVHKASRITPSEHLVEMVQYSRSKWPAISANDELQNTM